MRTDARWFLAGLLLLLPAWTARSQEEPETPPPAAAEEPEEVVSSEPPSKLAGKLSLQLNFWYSQPAGMEHFAASETNPNSTFATSVLDVPYSAEWRPRYQISYALDNDAGMFIGSYFAENQRFKLIRSDPGNFKYGETLTVPLHAGLFDDGTADAFDARTHTKHREWRLAFARRFLDTPRVEARWSAGWREVNHTDLLQVAYRSLNPSPELFPLVIFPTPGTNQGPRLDLVPNDDTALTSTGYSGRGPEAGFDFLFPFGKSERFSIETGLAFGVLRGDMTSEYASVTSFYAVVFDGVINEYLLPPYPEFLEIDPRPEQPPNTPLLNSIQQIRVPLGLRVATAQTNGIALDAYLGFRCRVFKGIEVAGGFRSAYYDHAGTVVRPAGATISPNGVINFHSITEKKSSVLYEGFYLGVAYTY